MEEIDRDTAIVPASVAATEILRQEIVIGQRVSKVILGSRSTGHQIAPQHVFANVVECVAYVTALTVFSCETGIAGIGRDTETCRTLFVICHDPWSARLG